MGLSNRTRDFTTNTYEAIRTQLDGPKEVSREFTSFWNSHGSAFDTVDYSGDASAIDNFVSETRNLVSVIAPTKFEEVFTTLKARDADFGQQCEDTTTELVTYGLGLDFLIQTIGSAAFPANFDRDKVSSTLAELREVTDQERSQYFRHLAEQYGFGLDTIILIWKLYEGLETQFPNISDERRTWMLNRLIGGFHYGSGGFFDSLQWAHVAGGSEFWQHLGYTSEQSFFEAMGFTEWEYNSFKAMVRVQHMINEIEDTSWENLCNNLDLYNRFKAEMENGYGGKWSFSELEAEWKRLVAQMGGTTDYAHQQITMATYLANDLGYVSFIGNMATGWNAPAMAGWLGDAVLGANGRGTAFASDDYRSDLDAHNIHHLMKSENLTYMEAFTQYYRSITASNPHPNRAEQFLATFDNGLFDVQAEIIDKLRPDLDPQPPVVPVESASTWTYEEQQAWIEEYIVSSPEMFNDTHRFLQSLGYGGLDPSHSMVP